MSDEIERLRQECDTLRHERRRIDEEWRSEDREWKKEIKETVNGLVRTVDETNQRSSRHSQEIQGIKDDVTQVNLAIYGNPVNQTKGLAFEVDRLNESAKTTSWFAKTALGAAITGCVAWAWSHIKGHP